MNFRDFFFFAASCTRSVQARAGKRGHTRRPTSGKTETATVPTEKVTTAMAPTEKGRVGSHYPTTSYTGRTLYTTRHQEKGGRGKAAKGKRPRKQTPTKRERALTETKRANAKTERLTSAHPQGKKDRFILTAQALERGQGARGATHGRAEGGGWRRESRIPLQEA